MAGRQINGTRTNPRPGGGGSSAPTGFQFITVFNEVQYLAAFTTLNAGGAGVIIIGASFPFTANHTLDHSNIEVWGLNNSITIAPYKLTVVGNQLIYKNTIFVGGVVDDTSNTSEIIVLADDGGHVSRVVFDACVWYNCVMNSSATHYVIKYDAADYGYGISFMFKENSVYSLHSNTADVMDGFSIHFEQSVWVTDITFINLASQQAGTAQERRRYCNKVRVSGADALKDRSYLLTDGSAVFVGGLPVWFSLVNTIIYPQIITTAVADTDLFLLQDSLGSNTLKGITRPNLMNVVANGETLAATKTLVETDSTYQFLKTGGADRIVNLPTPTVNKIFIIKNNDNYDSAFKLIVKIGSTAIENLWATKESTYVWDGSYWRKGTAGSGSGYGASYEDNNILIGSGAKADNTDGGMAIGKNATANSGMVVGSGSTANYRSTVVGAGSTDNGGIGGVIIGQGAIGSSGAYGYDVVVGAGSTCASSTGVNTLVGRTCSASGTGSAALGYSVILIDDYQVGLGANAAPKRYGEISHTNNLNRSRTGILEWYGSKSNNTPGELFLNGRFGNDKRLTVEANTAGTFHIMVIARDHTSGDAASWVFDGMFKRNTTAASTTVSGLVKTVINRDDATWDCDITADTTNGAVIITITSDATNAVRWSGRGDLIEVTQN